jgi:hypothetical protein
MFSTAHAAVDIHGSSDPDVIKGAIVAQHMPCDTVVDVTTVDLVLRVRVYAVPREWEYCIRL